MGYPVSKAVAITDSIDLTAWFTPKIPIKSEPYIYGDLPGLILKLKSESKEQSKEVMTFEAKSIEVIDGEIVKPTNGRELSLKQFLKEQSEMLKKMREYNAQGVDTD